MEPAIALNTLYELLRSQESTYFDMLVDFADMSACSSYTKRHLARRVTIYGVILLEVCPRGGVRTCVAFKLNS